LKILIQNSFILSGLIFLQGFTGTVEAQYSSLLQTTFKLVLGLFLEIKFVTGTHARSIDVLPQNNKVRYWTEAGGKALRTVD